MRTAFNLPHSTIRQSAEDTARANSNARAGGRASAPARQSEAQIEAKTKTKTKSKIAFCVVIPKIDATPKPETDIETAKISIKLVAIRQQSRDDACASLAKQSLLGHG